MIDTPTIVPTRCTNEAVPGMPAPTSGHALVSV